MRTIEDIIEDIKATDLDGLLKVRLVDAARQSNKYNEVITVTCTYKHVQDRAYDVLFGIEGIGISEFQDELGRDVYDVWSEFDSPTEEFRFFLHHAK